MNVSKFRFRAFVLKFHAIYTISVITVLLQNI